MLKTRAGLAEMASRWDWEEMAKKSLKVDRQKFEGIVKNLLHSKPVSLENVKIKNPKNREQLIPPQKG